MPGDVQRAIPVALAGITGFDISYRCIDDTTIELNDRPAQHGNVQAGVDGQRIDMEIAQQRSDRAAVRCAALPGYGEPLTAPVGVGQEPDFETGRLRKAGTQAITVEGAYRPPDPLTRYQRRAPVTDEQTAGAAGDDTAVPQVTDRCS